MNIEWMPAYVLDIIICVLFLMTVLTGLKDGIFKKIYNLICFAVLIILLWLAVPMLGSALEGTGWIQGVVAKLPEEVKSFFESALGTTFYSFLAGLIIVICFSLIQLIVGIAIRKILKRKSALCRILGGAYGLVSGFIISSVLLVCVASPTLFGEVGAKKISEAPITSTVYQGTVGMQNALKSVNLPYSLESVGARALAGKDATKEDVDRYTVTISRLPELKDELINVAQGGEIDTTKYLNEDGSINQEEANLLVDDTIVILDLVNKMPEDQKAQAVAEAERALTDVSSQLVVDGKPKDTIIVTAEQKESLNKRLDALGISEELKTTLNICLVVE